MLLGGVASQIVEQIDALREIDESGARDAEQLGRRLVLVFGLLTLGRLVLGGGTILYDAGGVAAVHDADDLAALVDERAAADAAGDRNAVLNEQAVSGVGPAHEDVGQAG